MVKRKPASRRQNKVMKVLYLVVGSIAIGFFPALLLPSDYGPRVAIVLAAGGIIPIGMRSSSLLRGALVGLGLGLLAGYAIPMGIIQKGIGQNQAMSPDQMINMTILYTIATAMLCGGVSLFFAHLARKRTQRIEDEWQ